MGSISYVFSVLLLLSCLSTISISLVESKSKLTVDYYNQTCPDFEKILSEVVVSKQISTPTTAAALLRLFFHDCIVDGCDSSTLIASRPDQKAERDADINLSLPGDAFDVVTRIKTALELRCPEVVSCSDIMAVATRNLVTMVGGPYYTIRLGRKDSKVSDPSRVMSNIAVANNTVDEMIAIFKAKGLSVKDLVALSGAHTIGFSHCKEFADRLFHYSKKIPTDPSLNPEYATALKKLCGNYTVDKEMSAFNDVFTPGKFDNMYFKNLQRGLGLLASDQILAKDSRTKPFVDLYAANQTAFFDDFARAMERVSLYDIKRGKNGEIRRRCDQFNAYQA